MNHDLVCFPFSDLGSETHWQREGELLQRFNHLPPEAQHERPELLKALFAQADEVIISPPLAIARGHLITLSRKVFINYNAQIAAAPGAPITIGHHTIIAPNVQIQTGTHPVDPTERQKWAYCAKGITIGNNVWIGAGAIICGGVTIGDHSVIGAGSIVTRDVPSCVLVGGNPARVIRELTPPDESTLYALNP
ncbi:sugar O-acetyltransferase [uncultured Deefgea sp.]|uniref:sugar O-acetyltransferase n=1 Tax=uncultured Deefgea sp. TaxID=1304914 RepID=UPI00260A71F5|nr:sugar O-acetyltransferase [uncultured Deefgea sp.]